MASSNIESSVDITDLFATITPWRGYDASREPVEKYIRLTKKKIDEAGKHLSLLTSQSNDIYEKRAEAISFQCKYQDLVDLSDEKFHSIKDQIEDVLRNDPGFHSSNSNNRHTTPDRNEPTELETDLSTLQHPQQDVDTSKDNCRRRLDYYSAVSSRFYKEWRATNLKRSEVEKHQRDRIRLITQTIMNRCLITERHAFRSVLRRWKIADHVKFKNKLWEQECVDKMWHGRDKQRRAYAGPPYGLELIEAKEGVEVPLTQEDLDVIEWEEEQERFAQEAIEKMRREAKEKAKKRRQARKNARKKREAKENAKKTAKEDAGKSGEDKENMVPQQGSARSRGKRKAGPVSPTRGKKKAKAEEVMDKQPPQENTEGQAAAENGKARADGEPGGANADEPKADDNKHNEQEGQGRPNLTKNGKRRGRPPGSKNKPKVANVQPPGTPAGPPGPPATNADTPVVDLADLVDKVSKASINANPPTQLQETHATNTDARTMDFLSATNSVPRQLAAVPAAYGHRGMGYGGGSPRIQGNTGAGGNRGGVVGEGYGLVGAENAAGQPAQQNPSPFQQNPFLFQHPLFRRNPLPFQQNPLSLQQHPVPLQENALPLQENPFLLQQNPPARQEQPLPFPLNPLPARYGWQINNGSQAQHLQTGFPGQPPWYFR